MNFLFLQKSPQDVVNVWFLSFVIPFILLSCGVGDAELMMDEFHKKLDAKEYGYIVENMIHADVINETGEEAWFKLFEDIEAFWGTPVSREKETGFQSKYDNGVTRVKLDYELNYEGNKKVFERVFLADSGDGFKITGLFLNSDKSKLEKEAGNLK